MNTSERNFSKQKTWIKAVQIFLLILIILGVALLATQKHWVPKVVNYIIANDAVEVVNDIAEVVNHEEAPPSSPYSLEVYPIEESPIFSTLGAECVSYLTTNNSVDARLVQEGVGVMVPSLTQTIYGQEPTCPHAEKDFTIISASESENYLIIQDSPICLDEENCELNYKLDLSTTPPTVLSIF